MNRFSKLISDNEFIDMPLIGSKFTWSNNQDKATLCRIDQFLLLKEWDEHFDGAIQMALSSGISNHKPIMLNTEKVDWGPKPFRFENSWLYAEEFFAFG